MITVSGNIVAIEEKDVLPEYQDEPSDFIHCIRDHYTSEKVEPTKVIAESKLGNVGDHIEVRVFQGHNNRLVALA